MFEKQAFTLIELLIVVAIIAILAAIAVPNFLEAQVRSKVSRAVADMRTVATGIEAYIVDYNREPPVMAPPSVIDSGDFSAWWGFLSSGLTTPVAYMTTLPRMPFIDKTVLGYWQQLGGTGNNQPYTLIRNTFTSTSWPIGQVVVAPGAPTDVELVPISTLWNERSRAAGYIIYTSGPDGVDGTVWGSPQFYDPTNGTTSYGDVHRFGSGAPGQSVEDDNQ